MKKKIFLIISLVLLFVGAFVISASATEMIDGIYYSFSGDNATVTSDNRNCELEAVVIPEKVSFNGAEYKVTKIAEKAFGSANKNGGNSKIKSLIVPSTIEEIGEYAFANCASLESAYCKSSKIGKRMFFDCASLKDLTLENTKEIGAYAFTRIGISSVVLPSTLTKVDSYAFKACPSLTKIVVLGSVMGEYMFNECSLINHLVITESFSTYSTNCLGVANNKKFTTYYTGTDYERIKEICSSTSRFSEAGYISFADYESGNYEKLPTYDVNLCVAGFDGVHTEPNDDGDCTTAVVCSVCSDYTYKEAIEHLIGEEIKYTSFEEDGIKIVGCLNEGCENNTVTVAPAFFECRGYSVSENDDGGITVGFGVNGEAIKEYEELMGLTIGYGVFVAPESRLGDNDIFDENGEKADGVFIADITNCSFSIVVLKMVGFNDLQKDMKFAIGAYIAINDGKATDYSYIQTEKPIDGERYHFISYNDKYKSKNEE